MIKQYADISPDILVRNNLASLIQGVGTVQSYYDTFRAVLSLAVKHPVVGADAVWFFKQGLSEKIRTAIAVYGDDDMDTVVIQAKRVDAALNASSAGAAPSVNAHIPTVKGSANAGASKRSGPSWSAGVDPKRAKSGAQAGGVATPALVALRTAAKVCVNCGVAAASHEGAMGRACPAPFLAPDKDEQSAMSKGKNKA